MAITATENEEKNTKADCDALVSLHKTPWIRREWKFPFWFHDSVVLDMFYLNTIEQLFLMVVQLDQLEVCLHYSRLLAGIPMLAVFKNLRWNSNKTSLLHFCQKFIVFISQCIWIEKNQNFKVQLLIINPW